MLYNGEPHKGVKWSIIKQDTAQRLSRTFRGKEVIPDIIQFEPISKIKVLDVLDYYNGIHKDTQMLVVDVC